MMYGCGSIPIVPGAPPTLLDTTMLKSEKWTLLRLFNDVV